MAAARHLVSTFHLIHMNSTSLLLEDAERLASIQTTAIRLSWIQARHTIGNLVVLCHVFLGAAHPLTLGLAFHFQTMVSREIHLEHMMAPTASAVPRHLLPCYYIRWQQLRFSRWFSKQLVTMSNVNPPDFNQLLDDIDDRINWLPDFPAHQLPTIFPTSAPTPRPANPSPPMGPLAASQPPPPPADAPPLPPATTPNRRIDNTAFNEALFGRFKSMPGCTMPALRAIWAAQTPPVVTPKTANGRRHRCLAYHVKDMCYAVCRRSDDHVPASAADDAILEAFCNQHWHL